MGEGDRLERLHERYLEQAGWTAESRRQLLDGVGISQRSHLLEVGAGTGAIGASTASTVKGFHALDIDPSAVRFGVRHVPSARWCIGDAHALPYASAVFDAVLFHFTLMWLDDPAWALREARRVTRHRGAILALAEPDHSARIDHPESLIELGALQTDSLERQGADVRMGRRLRALFAGAGLERVTTGVFGGRWSSALEDNPPGLEWEVLRRDLEGRITESELARWENADREAWRREERILFVPTFYASGRVS